MFCLFCTPLSKTATGRSHTRPTRALTCHQCGLRSASLLSLKLEKLLARSHLQDEQRCQTYLNEGFARDSNTETYMVVYGFFSPSLTNRNDLTCWGQNIPLSKHTHFQQSDLADRRNRSNRKTQRLIKPHATIPSMIILNKGLPCT